MPSNHPLNSSVLLSIKEASRLLGVSEVTLRQWTSEGRVKAFITPGGHRRYSETELRRFKEAGPRTHGVKDIVARMEQASAQEMEIANTRFAGTSWYNKLDADSLAKLGHLGRKVYGLVLTYVSKPGKREETLVMARDVGREFGECLVQMGLPLTDALEAFMAHRAPLIDAATELIKSRKGVNGRAAEAIPLVTRITDVVLLSLVEAYESRVPKENRKVAA